MGIVPYLPSIIVLLLIVSTVTLFIFWLGLPTRRKLFLAQLSLAYLFILNGLLAITTNVMIYKDPASVDKSPVSLLMMLLPLGVGVLLYRAGLKRQAEIPEEQGTRAQSAKAHKPGKSGKQGQWKVIDNNAVPRAGKGFSETWVMVLFLVSALAYAPAMFMLDSKEKVSPGHPPASSVEQPNSVTSGVLGDIPEDTASFSDVEEESESQKNSDPENRVAK